MLARVLPLMLMASLLLVTLSGSPASAADKDYYPKVMTAKEAEQAKADQEYRADEFARAIVRLLRAYQQRANYGAAAQDDLSGITRASVTEDLAKAEEEIRNQESRLKTLALSVHSASTVNQERKDVESKWTRYREKVGTWVIAKGLGYGALLGVISAATLNHFFPSVPGDWQFIPFLDLPITHGWSGASIWASLIGATGFQVRAHYTGLDSSRNVVVHILRREIEKLPFIQEARTETRKFLSDAFWNRLDKRWKLGVPKTIEERAELLKLLCKAVSEEFVLKLNEDLRRNELVRFSGVLQNAADLFDADSAQERYLLGMKERLTPLIARNQNQASPLTFEEVVAQDKTLAELKTALVALGESPSFANRFVGARFDVKERAQIKLIPDSALGESAVVHFFNPTSNSRLTRWILENAPDALAHTLILELAAKLNVDQLDPSTQLELIMKPKIVTQAASATREIWVDIEASIMIPHDGKTKEVSFTFGFDTDQDNQDWLVQHPRAIPAFKTAFDVALRESTVVHAILTEKCDLILKNTGANLPQEIEHPTQVINQGGT